jgi:hypothetical protein
MDAFLTTIEHHGMTVFWLVVALWLLIGAVRGK